MSEIFTSSGDYEEERPDQPKFPTLSVPIGFNTSKGTIKSHNFPTWEIEDLSPGMIVILAGDMMDDSLVKVINIEANMDNTRSEVTVEFL